MRKSGFIEHQVDKPEPHLENQKIMMKGFKISSNFVNIRKIWEDKTSFEKIEPGSSVTTNSNCDEPMKIEERPPIFGQTNGAGGD